MLKVVNQDHNGNINMLLIGGDKQFDGKIVTVTECQSAKPYQTYVRPKIPVLPCRGISEPVTDLLERECYLTERVRVGNSVIKYYRHESLTVEESLIKLFNDYKEGQ